MNTMNSEPKTLKQAFEAEMLGNIGIVHDKVNNLNEKLDAFNEKLPALTQGAVEVMGLYDARAEKLYGALVEANVKIDMSSRMIAGAATMGVDQLHDRMDAVVNQTVGVTQAFINLHEKIAGDNGLEEKVSGVAAKFDGNLWQLEKQVSALSKMQNSAFAEHSKALVGIQITGAAVVGFVAGQAVQSNFYAVGMLFVGVFFGWAITKLFSKQAQA